MTIVIVALSDTPPSNRAEVPNSQGIHQSPDVIGNEIAGAPFDLKALRGHFMGIDFLAGWYLPCRTERPELVMFGGQHNGALLVGIIFEDTTPAIPTLLGALVGR